MGQHRHAPRPPQARRDCGPGSRRCPRVAPNIYFNVKYPETLGRYKGDLIPVPLKDYVTGKLRRSLIALWSAVGAILLIAGVNLSNLLLARAGCARQGVCRPWSTRGEPRPHRAPTAHGKPLALRRGRGLRAWTGPHPDRMARAPGISGSAAAQHAAHRQPGAGLDRSHRPVHRHDLRRASGAKGGQRQSAGGAQGLRYAGAGLGRKHERVRAALVVSEVALACVLLVSAGLLMRSFLKVLDVDLGFQPDRAASIKIDYDDSAPSGDASQAKRGAIFQQILARVSALPGVEAAGMADYLPLGPNREWDTPVPQGKTFAPGELPDPLVYVITPGFIHAMGIRLHGRDFTWADGPHSERVVLINASAARVYWPGEDAVGKILMRGTEEDRVVGVVDDVHEENVEGGAGSQIYYPATQQGPDGAQLVVRTSLPPAALAASVLHALRELNPKQPAAEFRPIRTIVDRAVSPRRFFMLLVAAFAGLGLAAGRPRHLRRHLLLGHPENPGDRSPHGAWSERGARAARSHSQHIAPCAGRHRSGNNRVRRISPADRVTSLRNFTLGRDHLCRRDAVARRGGLNLRLSTRTKSFWHRPNDCFA